MDKVVNKYLAAKRLSRCKSCNGQLEYMGLGEYRCSSCGAIYLDDYGKVRDYLEKNGPTPAVHISRATGVGRETVNALLYEGRVEIPEGSRQYIKCAKCGCSLKFGRICPKCASEMSGKDKNLIVGEVPKIDNSSKRSIEFGNNKGRMHFLSEEDSRISRF